MQKNENKAAPDRAEKAGGAIDRARQDGGEDDDKNGIEGSLLGERTFAAQAHHHEREHEYDHAPQRDLRERQVFWLGAQTEERTHEMVECLHPYKFIAAGM